MNDSRDQAKPTGMPLALIVIANHGAPHQHFAAAREGRDILCDVCLPRDAEFLSSSRQSMISAHGLMMLVPNFLLDWDFYADEICLSSASNLKRQVEEDTVNKVQPSKAECWHTPFDFIPGHFVNSAVQIQFNFNENRVCKQTSNLLSHSDHAIQKFIDLFRCRGQISEPVFKFFLHQAAVKNVEEPKSVKRTRQRSFVLTTFPKKVPAEKIPHLI